jgi:uncharacterized repeat protein (TIGR03803 family)
MKTCKNILVLLLETMASLGLMLAGRATVQTFTTLHSAPAPSGNPSTNSDGWFRVGGMILSGNTLYGTAGRGGTNSWGTVFAVSTDGTGFTTLHSFTTDAVLSA